MRDEFFVAFSLRLSSAESLIVVTTMKINIPQAAATIIENRIMKRVEGSFEDSREDK